MIKRKWTYTLSEIANASHTTLRSIREHRRKGVFNPDSIVSVASYIIGRRMNDIRDDRRKDGGAKDV